jgi:hypothetical protein
MRVKVAATVWNMAESAEVEVMRNRKAAPRPGNDQKTAGCRARYFTWLP